MDRRMDCRKAASCAVDPEGRMLLDAGGDESRIFTVDLPLTDQGRLDDTPRRRSMASRCPHRYNDCYLNLRPILDLTAFLNLPSPGILALNGVVPREDQHPIDALRDSLDEKRGPSGLFLLPPFGYSEEALARIGEIAHGRQIGVATCRQTPNGQRCFFYPASADPRHWPFSPSACAQAGGYPLIDFASARLKLAAFDLLNHPEAVVATAKKGCDLLIALDDRLTADRRLLAGVRTIENLAVAGCTPNGAGIWLPPEGHQRWGEQLAGPGAVCRCRLDTHRTRQKRFQDNIDFATLLKRSGRVD
jgi:hypothetical protein